MLETEEIDDDFFTPVAGTSLANIFGNVSKANEGKANDSLKYVPPKPQNTVTKQEQTKATECIFACALLGHEWFNNIYTARGKLGFAIVKIQKTGAHNIVLYDSNKTTLSCTTISTDLEVTIKNETYISYYDSQNKYWSIYGTKEEVKKVTELLTTYGVNIKYSSYTSDQGPPEPKVDIKPHPVLEQIEKTDKGSDTDSSINRKTKASILNRMANMGHSVLPARTLPVERTSDSSDTMENETHPKLVRHKPVVRKQSIVKKNNTESIPDSQQLTESHQRIILPKTETLGNIPLYSSYAGQLLPMTNTNLITSPSNELGMFISEQRISNSELRINMNRITDKVDSVLDKISNFHQKASADLHTEILMKLLTEYENKIKGYEELLKSRGEKNASDNDIPKTIIVNNDYQIEMLKGKISELEKINQEKSHEISSLQNEQKNLEVKHITEIHEHLNSQDVLQSKIINLEKTLKEKNEELKNMIDKHEKIPDIVNTNADKATIGDKVKGIMNDTFQTISVNFDNDQNYTGKTIKRIVAAVIKKITIQTINEL